MRAVHSIRCPSFLLRFFLLPPFWRRGHQPRTIASACGTDGPAYILRLLCQAGLALGPLSNLCAQTPPPDPSALPAEAHVYRTIAGRDLSLWVFKPADWQAGDRRPAIVFFHGGGWTNGNASQFAPQGRHLAALGLVAISVQYRFVDRERSATPDVCVEDARAAFQWVAAHAAELGIDPTRIAAGGGSAGGHLAACTTFGGPEHSARPAALILFNPVVNFTVLPGTTNANRAAREKVSPSHHLSAHHPPTLILVGDRDTTTPPVHDQAYAAALTKLGVRAEVKLYPGQVHGFFNYKPEGNPWYDATLADVVGFLASLGWIKPPPTS